MWSGETDLTFFYENSVNNDVGSGALGGKKEVND